MLVSSPPPLSLDRLYLNNHSLSRSPRGSSPQWRGESHHPARSRNTRRCAGVRRRDYGPQAANELRRAVALTGRHCSCLPAAMCQTARAGCGGRRRQASSRRPELILEQQCSCCSLNARQPAARSRRRHAGAEGAIGGRARIGKDRRHGLAVGRGQARRGERARREREIREARSGSARRVQEAARKTRSRAGAGALHTSEKRGEGTRRVERRSRR
jgi:hypothetical protein